MTNAKFNESVTMQLEYCKKLLTSKGEEYAPEYIEEPNGQLRFNVPNAEYDRLASFKRAAALEGVNPRAALFGMLAKHIISVSDMCQGENTYSLERWEEKITDSINYFVLLRALVEEEADEKY